MSRQATASAPLVEGESWQAYARACIGGRQESGKVENEQRRPHTSGGHSCPTDCTGFS